MGLSVVRTGAELRAWVTARRASGASVGLAPTMGALHDGHLSLVRLARDETDAVVASLFVNPTQFGPDEDFTAYPRDERRDMDLLEANGCDLLFAPPTEEIYPPGFSTTVTVGELAEPLEGEFRSGHFAGVATVLTKLLILCRPDTAVFGEKDYQQLQVIRRLVRDLNLPVRLIGAPIVRDPDGLALSSRNVFLSAVERAAAPALHQALALAAERLRKGWASRDVEAAAVTALQDAGFRSVDYFQARDPDDLRRLGPGPLAAPARLLGAARLGPIRLIDNLAT